MNIFKTTCERAGPTDHSIHAHRTLPYQDNGGGRLAKRNWHGRNARALRERWPCQHDSPSHAASGEVSDDMRGSARLARVETSVRSAVVTTASAAVSGALTLLASGSGHRTLTLVLSKYAGVCVMPQWGVKVLLLLVLGMLESHPAELSALSRRPAERQR